MMGDGRGMSVNVSMLVYVSVHLIACGGVCIHVHPGVCAVLHCLSMPSCMCRCTCGLGLRESVHVGLRICVGASIGAGMVRAVVLTPHSQHQFHENGKQAALIKCNVGHVER